jgi:hypothetical protein
MKTLNGIIKDNLVYYEHEKMFVNMSFDLLKKMLEEAYDVGTGVSLPEGGHRFKHKEKFLEKI